MKPITVLIVDDHAILRMGLASLLANKKGIEVVGDAASGAAALTKVRKLKPDVVVMDLMMPGMDGAEATRRILEVEPGTKVLILTTYGTANALAHALDAGARGAVLKNEDFTDLVDSIRTVAAGGRAVSPEIEQMLATDPPLPELAPRQREILESITKGLSNADIATQLGISLPTVKEHVKALLDKIGASNRSEAIGIAMRKYLLKI